MMQTFDVDQVIDDLEKDKDWRKSSTEEFLDSLTNGLSSVVRPSSDSNTYVSSDDIRKRFELVPSASLVTARERIVNSISSSIQDISKESTVIGKVLEEAYVLMMKKILENPDGVSLGMLQELTSTLNSIRNTQVTTVQSFFTPVQEKGGGVRDPIINIVFNSPEETKNAKREAEVLTANISNFAELAQLADLANIVSKDRPVEVIDVTPVKDSDDE